MLQTRRLVICLLTLVFLFSVSAVDGLAAQKTFKLGVLAPFTGGAAKTGSEMKDGVKLAMKGIDYKIGDYQIELVYMDDQSDPAKGTNAYSEAIERKGVQAGILNWNTAVTVAIQKMLVRYRIPHFFCMGAGSAGNQTWQSLAPEDRYLIMKGWSVPQKLVKGYAPCINDAIDKGRWSPKKKLLGLWGEDTDYGRSIIADGIKKYMTAEGWEVFTEEYFPYAKTEFYAFLNKNKNAGVTLLAGSTGSLPSVSGILKQGHEIGFKGMKIVDGLGYFGNWYQMTGPAADGVLDMQPRIATPEQKAWVKKFKAEYGYDPSPSAAGMSYDYTNFFVKIAKRAIEKYGELSSETLTKVGREEIWTGELKYGRDEGALMHARYGTDAESRPDPTIGEEDFAFPVIQYKKGTGYIVYPYELSEMEIMVPK